MSDGTGQKHIVGYFPSWSIHAENYHVTDIPAAQLKADRLIGHFDELPDAVAAVLPR